MLLLKANERNWGLVSPGSWEKRSWKINTDGWYQYKESYRSGSPEITEIPDVVEEGALSSVQLSRIQEALEMDWTDETADASDGTAWEFKMYDGDTVVKHRELGYICGLEPYERIAAVLTEEDA